jgi:hypothetical protein
MSTTLTDPRVPLVRAEGKVFAEGYPTLGPTEFVNAPVLLRESRSDIARAAEASFGFQPSLYFYVGFSHPSFGDAVLVYEPESFDLDQGGATPFDSGGFHRDHIVVAGVTSPTAKREYVTRSDVRLNAWRAGFTRYVAEHFESAKAYVQGQSPTQDDLSHRLGDAMDRRAWTWELRLHRDHPVFEQLRHAYLNHDYAEEIRELLRTGDPSNLEVWSRRLAQGIIESVEPGRSPHRVALDDIARTCG